MVNTMFSISFHLNSIPTVLDMFGLEAEVSNAEHKVFMMALANSTSAKRGTVTALLAASALALGVSAAEAKAPAPIERGSSRSAEAARSEVPSMRAAVPAGKGGLIYTYPDQPDVQYGPGARAPAAAEAASAGDPPAAPGGVLIYNEGSGLKALSQPAPLPRGFDAQAVARDNEARERAAPRPVAVPVARSTVMAVPQRTPAAGPVAAPASVADKPSWKAESRVGAPYEAAGLTYVPTAEPGFAEEGVATVYEVGFQGRKTASGEVFDNAALLAAHPTLPLPGLIQVTNLENGKTATVRLVDRGPFVDGRMLRLSGMAAQVLGMSGDARVHVRYLGEAPTLLPVSSESATRLAAMPIAPPKALEPVSLTPIALTSVAVGKTDTFMVQAGAFSDQANANRLRDRLSVVGGVEVTPLVSAAGQSLWRVRVGPFSDADEADAARVRIEAAGAAGARVVAAR
jgi:rare lipoprotein A